ncbi:3-hydroxyacyl-CoA dehydrogenase family protein [Jatrophihabitans fulvus]
MLTLSRVAVVGAGLMGRGIARVFAEHGHDVALFDLDAAALDGATAGMHADGLDVGRAIDLTDLAHDADLVVEAVVEDLAVKQDLLAELSRITDTAVLATNTSVLPVTAIAAHTRRPERVVGTHWWNPPDLVPVVEVVRGERSEAAALDAVTATLTALGKLPVRVERDVPGFIGNRLQHALWREAIALVADGVCDAATVDLVVRNTIGLRLATLGPLENADLVGLDLTLAIHSAVLASLNADPHPSPLLEKHVADGRLGAKSGSGFLAWPPGTREATTARLHEHVRRQLAATP